MDPFLVIVRARNRLFKSGVKRRVSRGSKRSRLLAIDHEPEESCLEGKHYVI